MELLNLLLIPSYFLIVIGGGMYFIQTWLGTEEWD